jgi:hypothetical protein
MASIQVAGVMIKSNSKGSPVIMFNSLGGTLNASAAGAPAGRLSRF